MIGYTTVGTSDMARAKQFYCDLFESKGAKVLIDSGRIAMIGTGGGTPMMNASTSAHCIISINKYFI